MRLGPDWLNTEVPMEMFPDVQQQLTNEAIAQNVVAQSLRFANTCSSVGVGIFRKGLPAVVQIRPYDSSDDVQYMHQVRPLQRVPISIGEVEQWARRYRHTIDGDFLKTIDGEYGRRYCRNCIVRAGR